MKQTEALCSPLSTTDFSTPGRGGKALGQMGAELPCWWASVSVLAVLTAHPSWWQVLWIHNSVQQLPGCRQLGQQPCIPAPVRGDDWHSDPGVASWYAPAPWQWPGWSYRKGSWVFHSCVLGFSSKSCVLWSPLTTSALLASAKGNGGTSAKNTFLWECIQLPPTSVPKSALKKEAEFSPIYVNLGRCYFQGYFKVNGIPAKIWTPFTLCLVPGVCLFRKEQVIKVMPAALP